MEDSNPSQTIKVALWLFILTALSLGSFVLFFFATVSFLSPIPRFLFSFLINVALSYWITCLVKVTGSPRIFLALIPPLASILFFVGLVIMQHSNFHCIDSANNCFYILGSSVCGYWILDLIKMFCSL